MDSDGKGHLAVSSREELEINVQNLKPDVVGGLKEYYTHPTLTKGRQHGIS